MLDYAVTLEFDKESRDKIQEMIDEIAAATGRDYMKKAGIPPHVTVSMVVSDDEESVLSDMEDISKTLKSGNVVFTNIGVFNPQVIYLGPVVNEYLQETCKLVNGRLLKHAEAGNNGYYLPNQWVPHSALAVELDAETLKEAFAIVQAKFIPFAATAERIILARAFPYEEIGSWKLN